MSSALIGCLGGAILSGALADRFGRKRLLVLAGLIFALSSIGTALAGSFTIFVLNRLAGRRGDRPGVESVADVHRRDRPGRDARQARVDQPAHHRHRHLAGPGGQLADRRAGPPGATAEQILASWNGQIGWRWMFGVTAVPALFSSWHVLRARKPALAGQGRSRAAMRADPLQGRRRAYARSALAEIRKTLADDPNAGRVEVRELLDPRIRPAVVIGVVLAVFQQWCGINVIFNYAEEIFSSAGYGVSDILFNIVITGLVNLVFTFVAIGTVDRVGRRSLMLVGSAGLAVIYVLIGLSYAIRHARARTCCSWSSRRSPVYGCTLAPVTWVVLSEIFPNRVRGHGDGRGRLRPLGWAASR